MSRFTRDSDDELDVKAGRKTRGLAGSSAVDSPLRRSLRNKPATKQNESSSESPLSDASNASNTQVPKATRRRAGTMDNSAAPEKSRKLRSRRSSVASDASELAEMDSHNTPTKKTRGIAGRDILNKTTSRTSNRFTRAGSEAKSPPTASRVTRRMRCSSTEPEGVVDVISTPIKTKRRASVLPSEATVAEEKEDVVMKVAVVTLDRTLANIKETSVSGLDNSRNSEGSNELSVLKDELHTSKKDIDEKSKEDKTCAVKEAHNNAADNPPNTFEDVKADVPVDIEKTISVDENSLEKSENFSTDTITKTETSVYNTSQVFSQSTNEDTTKELGVKIENLLSNSIKEQDKDVSNKENHTANIISDMQNREDTISNTLLQSPKPLSESNINTNKLTKEVCKSPSIEASVIAKRRCSKELSDATNDTALPIKKVSNNADVANNSAANANTSVNDEDGDSSDNMPKLVMSTDTESLSEVPINESLGRNASPVEICSNSSFDGSIQIVECTENVNKADNYKSIEVDENLKNPVENTSLDNECDQGTNIKMDISDSHVEETTNKNDESEKDGINQITSTDDKSGTKEEVNESNESENLQEIDAVKCMQENLSKSSDVSLVANTESIVSKNETTAHGLQDTEKANNSPTRDNTIPESSHDALTSPENSTSTNKNENVTDVVKSTQSSAVTEIPADATDEVPEKGELSKKTFLSDDPSTSRKSVDKSQSNNEEKKSEENQEATNKNQDNMEVDDNDSDTNTANLFQDIPADEWKEKNADVDKDSVHSMSTERLENESESDCDVVLCDREAWLVAENIKLKKENETFDYDSDDTVLLKIQRDSVKTIKKEKVAMDVSDECKMNVSKSKSLNTSGKQRSTQQKETENKEDVEKDSGDVVQAVKDAENETQDTEEAKDAENISKRKSITKETNEQSSPKCNVSTQKLVKEKSLSESHQTTEMKENSDKSFTSSPLNKNKLSDDISKKCKSFDKSVQEMDDKPEVSSETEFEKKRKSLNKSKSKESDMIETESSNENIIIPGKKKQSLNSSSKKRVKTKHVDANSMEESDNECKESEVTEKKSSSMKKTLHRNYSTAVNVESDSDVSRNNIDSEDSEDESVKLPKFLFGEGSNSDSDNENESNKSIDSDIQREYNLDGKEISEFPDDDVPGDECRASETESSDPDDNGSDLMDFVVDDDEVEEDEEENEEENEEDEEEGEDQEENEEEATEEEQEENKKVENKEELNNEKDAKEEEGTVEEDEEMKVEEEVDSIEEKKQTEDEPENVEKVHKLLDTSKKRKNKLRNSMDSSLTQMTENDKKETRRGKTDMSLTEKEDEEECNLSTVSLSNSLKTKKIKQKRVSSERTDDAKQLLNDSPMISNKKIEKLSKSMECSTPKTSSSKREKFNISMHTPDVRLEASCNNLTNETCEDKEDACSDKEEVEDKAQKIEKNSKKLSKLKGKENLMLRSLPSELIELVENTNVSRPASSKVSELNKTTLIPYSESPTVKHLRKEKLNDSAPELKLNSKSRKSINSSTKNVSSNSLKEIKEGNADVEDPDIEATKKVNDSLKKKLLKVADNILESDRQKKRKKRKQLATEKTSVQFSEVNFEENIDSQITEKKQKRDDSTVIIGKNEEEKETSVDKKKKKKKKKKKVVSMEVDEPVKEELSENFIETELENNNEPIHGGEKKKKKKGKKIEDDIENQVPTKKKAKNEKKIAVPYEEVPVAKVSKKKQKLLSKDVALESEQAPIEKVPKKKQKLSKDTALEQGEASDEKLPKKKQKLPKDTALEQGEVPDEKLPKKKQKLLSNDTDTKTSAKKLSKKKDKLSSENVSKNKARFVMATNKSQPPSDAVSESDEGPEVVAFSKARDEVLGMIKRTADSVKANKETKKKKQREHIERMQKEKEMKIQKLESKSQMKKYKAEEVVKKSVKRLPDEVLQNLSDVPLTSLKKRKLSQFDDQVLPSRLMFNVKDKETRDVHIEDDVLSSPSSYGSTTQFDVVNLQEMKKKKKVSGVASFRQKMLARNSRHPVSAYLMYLEKQKASGKDKFCHKP